MNSVNLSNRIQLPFLFPNGLLVGDNEILYSRSWLVKYPKLSIICLHDSFKHSGYFNYFAEWLNSYDMNLIAYDYRGFGRTTSGLVQPATFVADLHDCIHSVSRMAYKRPIILVGQGFGANLIMGALDDIKAPLKLLLGSILISPLTIKANSLSSTRLYNHNQLMESWLKESFTPEMLIDPFVKQEIEGQLIYNIVTMGNQFFNASSIVLPTLFLQGTQFIPNNVELEDKKQKNQTFFQSYPEAGFYLLEKTANFDPKTACFEGVIKTFIRKLLGQ